MSTDSPAASARPIEPLARGPVQAGLLELQRAVGLPELWSALQQLFETVVPHDTLVMSVNYLDWRREATTARLTSARSRVTEGEASSQLVVEEGRRFFQPFLEQHPGIPCYHHTQVLEDPRRIPATGYYRRYMLPLGWRYSAHLLFWRGEGVESSFALRRRADQGDYRPEEMELLGALHPHIGAALGRVGTVERERQRLRMLESIYASDPTAVLCLDWELNLLHVSPAAADACAQWNLGPRAARAYKSRAVFALPPAVVAGCEDLRRQWCTASVARPALPAAAPEPLVVTEPASGARAVVTLRPDGRRALARPAFIVRLEPVDTLPAAAPAGRHLRAQLTPAERELASLVAAGLTNKEISTRLSKTEGSVKVQLSGVFRKLRVRSRTQLALAWR